MGKDFHNFPSTVHYIIKPFKESGGILVCKVTFYLPQMAVYFTEKKPYFNLVQKRR